MKRVILLLSVVLVATACNRNRVGDEAGYVEPAATERSTITTGTSEKDAQSAGAGSATGPAGETSGGTYGTAQSDPNRGGNATPTNTTPREAQPNK